MVISLKTKITNHRPLDLSKEKYGLLLNHFRFKFVTAIKMLHTKID